MRPGAAFMWSTVLAVGLAASPAGANLLRNPSFEDTPCVTPCSQALQGIMPSEWLVLSVTPDTYSNDGSYGLAPADFGNFTGVLAHDGLRWVVGWSAATEMFGQVLSSPLVAGQEYSLSFYLHEAIRTDLAHPSSYQVELWDDATGASQLVLGSFAPPVDGDAWELRTLVFVAPQDAEAHALLAFRPLAGPEGSVYPGLDSGSLLQLAEPGMLSAAAAFLTGLLAAIRGSARRR